MSRNGNRSLATLKLVGTTHLNYKLILIKLTVDNDDYDEDIFRLASQLL